ncbi:cysteine hydrolase family protein [Natronorubrum sulfidifaciens]|uniref:Isochorismatase n=1 Tax=Natronorubrum sulfidifaciens JCM 14089 TaxID=1230460 RepID=L9WDG3_9EURY|nr:isochorismatase family cysteine hydrolase [Natronorubrum sulfidifaciens]ELY47505.1 isochorismatase [Natronorubrum sulfidifaciens JCM 14089]
MGDVVIVLDMLNDFVTGEIAADRAENIIPTLREELLPAAREHSVPVVYANDAHRPEDFELEVWGEHAMRGTEGAAVIDDLEPDADDHVFEKRFYDAFFETGLDQHLRSLGVDRLVITGLHTNMCVRHTSATGFFNGYEIVVPEDCTDAFTEDEYEDGLDYLARVYNADRTTASDLIEEWKASE